jgi:hypothetical protein
MKALRLVLKSVGISLLGQFFTAIGSKLSSISATTDSSNKTDSSSS